MILLLLHCTKDFQSFNTTLSVRYVIIKHKLTRKLLSYCKHTVHSTSLSSKIHCDHKMTTKFVNFFNCESAGIIQLNRPETFNAFNTEMLT